ncbi:PPE domain-containing protein [Actinopolyspora mortivallis]|uniref:PPE domain-containing protein n=1 Tax=Actinopolyspora mortivallis TaxID=33906 RepID=UPI00035DA27A|nr:PPE domain-containing protein [Actinopolyspora mortivallis]
MTDHRWQGYTHAELFELLHQGPGPSASGTCARRWSELGRALEEIDDDLLAALRSSGAEWQGEAAESARRALTPLENWAQRARQAAEWMRFCSEQQADFVARARAEMPAPVEITTERPNPVTSTLVHLFGGQTDYEQQEREQEAAEQRAFDVMRKYEDSSEANTTALASFEQPPGVVVDVPRTTSGSAPTGEITLSWGHSGRGGASVAPGASTGGTGTRSPGGARTAGSGRPAGAVGGPHGHGTGNAGRNTGGTTSSRDAEDEREESFVEVTDSPGGTGPFDEPRAPVRPVIGGDLG